MGPSEPVSLGGSVQDSGGQRVVQLPGGKAGHILAPLQTGQSYPQREILLVCLLSSGSSALMSLLPQGGRMAVPKLNLLLLLLGELGLDCGRD